MVEQKQEILAMEKRSAVDVVASKLKQLQASGELHLPMNYSAENALKSAWLILQSTVDRDKKPALTVCTKDSIANALLKMVTLGLNPEKKQGYFIVYGSQLSFDVSYFGDMHIAKSVDDTIYEIYPEVVYEGDAFEYEIKRGKKVITKHQQSLGNVDKQKIVAAYCVIVRENGSEDTTIMTMEEIKQSWKQSKMNPIDANGAIKADSTHGKFAAEMAKRTVIRKACKMVINASDDSNLFVKTYREATEATADVRVAAEIAENANGDIIDVTPTEVEDASDESTEEGQQEQSTTDGHAQESASKKGPGF